MEFRLSMPGALAPRDVWAPWRHRPGRLRVQVRRVEAGGYAAVCHEAGEGPALVLLASPLVRARTYRPLMRRLARHFRTTVVELPGSGLASPLLRPWTFSEYADWTAALLDRLGPASPWLIGHSDSGAMTLVLAARYPGLLRGLVLADAVGARRRLGLARVVGARLVDGLFEPGLDLRTAGHFASNLLWHTRNFLYRVRESSTVDLLNCAPQVTVPTLVAWGRHDHAMPLDCPRRLVECLPCARVHIGPGSHDWLVTRPEAFIRALLAFFQSVEAGGGRREGA